MLNLGAISIPFLCSFYTRANFSKTWKALAPAIILPAVIFISWDVLFTKWGVWGFNPRYLSGLYFFGLPIEEWLFFITIPYACTFTYFAMGHLVSCNPLKPIHKIISGLLIIMLFSIALLNLSKAYTSTTFISLSILLLILLLMDVPLERFYLTFLIILIPFFIINGILTGSFIPEEVVWYNNQENLDIRMFTIPVEDTFYGMLLLVMNTELYTYFQRKLAHKN